jgi:hypothetical protein
MAGNSNEPDISRSRPCTFHVNFLQPQIKVFFSEQVTLSLAPVVSAPPQARNSHLQRLAAFFSYPGFLGWGAALRPPPPLFPNGQQTSVRDKRLQARRDRAFQSVPAGPIPHERGSGAAPCSFERAAGAVGLRRKLGAWHNVMKCLVVLGSPEVTRFASEVRSFSGIMWWM